MHKPCNPRPHATCKHKAGSIKGQRSNCTVILYSYIGRLLYSLRLALCGSTYNCTWSTHKIRIMRFTMVYKHCSLAPRLSLLHEHMQYQLSLSDIFYRVKGHIAYTCGGGRAWEQGYIHPSPCLLHLDVLLPQATLSQCHDDHLYWHSGEQSSGTVI